MTQFLSTQLDPAEQSVSAQHSATFGSHVPSENADGMREGPSEGTEEGISDGSSFVATEGARVLNGTEGARDGKSEGTDDGGSSVVATEGARVIIGTEGARDATADGNDDGESGFIATEGASVGSTVSGDSVSLLSFITFLPLFTFFSDFIDGAFVFFSDFIDDAFEIFSDFIDGTLSDPLFFPDVLVSFPTPWSLFVIFSDVVDFVDFVEVVDGSLSDPPVPSLLSFPLPLSLFDIFSDVVDGSLSDPPVPFLLSFPLPLLLFVTFPEVVDDAFVDESEPFAFISRTVFIDSTGSFANSTFLSARTRSFPFLLRASSSSCKVFFPKATGKLTSSIARSTKNQEKTLIVSNRK
jgi:hypothetical protein